MSKYYAALRTEGAVTVEFEWPGTEPPTEAQGWTAAMEQFKGDPNEGHEWEYTAVDEVGLVPYQPKGGR